MLGLAAVLGHALMHVFAERPALGNRVLRREDEIGGARGELPGIADVGGCGIVAGVDDALGGDEGRW